MHRFVPLPTRYSWWKWNQINSISNNPKKRHTLAVVRKAQIVVNTIVRPRRLGVRETQSAAALLAPLRHAPLHLPRCRPGNDWRRCVYCIPHVSAGGGWLVGRHCIVCRSVVCLSPLCCCCCCMLSMMIVCC